jgi:phospholipid transport system substrate-binding protein
MMPAPAKAFVTAALRVAACCTVAMTLIAAPLAAAESNPTPDDAANFVKGLFDTARGLSVRNQSSDPERHRRLVAFVRSGVDLVAIARFSTGPFWKQASDAEHDRFLEVFETFVAQTFGRRLGELTGHTLKIVKSVALTPAADDSRDMLVTSRFVSDSHTFGVDWRVRMSATGPRIVDLVVEGISMAVAQRDEFITVIRNGGGKFDTLIAKLEEWTASPDDVVVQKSDAKPSGAEIPSEVKIKARH